MPSRWKPRLPSRSSTELGEERVAFRSHNEINVQGAGLELRHVELSHRCFSTVAFASRPAGNERKRIAPCRDGQRKIGWTASCATERPLSSSLFARSREKFCHSHVLPSRAVHCCRSSSTWRDRNSFRPFSPHLASLLQLQLARSLAKHHLPRFPHPRRFVFPTPLGARPGCISSYSHA